MSKRILSVYITNNTRSVDLLDRFEGIENGVRYDQICIKNKKHIWSDGCGFHTYQLIIERKKAQDDTVGDITFTNFKKGYTWNLDAYVRTQITPEVIAEYSGKDGVFYFEKPFHLRAQNSTNRCGYGWEWDWTYGCGSCVEGTFYGETSDYVFVGVYIA